MVEAISYDARTVASVRGVVLIREQKTRGLKTRLSAWQTSPNLVRPFPPLSSPFGQVLLDHFVVAGPPSPVLRRARHAWTPRCAFQERHQVAKLHPRRERRDGSVCGAQIHSLGGGG